MTHDPRPVWPTPTRTLILVYRAGTVVGGAAMLAGFAWFLPDAMECRFTTFAPTHLRDTGVVLGHLAKGDAMALMQLGVVLLALTPIARVAVLGGWFARRHEALFAALALGVLSILVYGWLA
jgi:uncharacterized membrane protein